MSYRCQHVPVPAALAICLAFVLGNALPAAADGLRVRPAEIRFDCPEACQQLLVDQPGGPPGDLTRRVVYRSQDPSVVVVTPAGQVLPRGAGRSAVVVEHSGARIVVPVHVAGWSRPAPISFRRDIIPILS